MKIFYLYSEVMGYTMATLRALAEQGVEVHVVHWNHKKLTPYEFKEFPGIHMYNRSELDVPGLKKLANKIDPTITVVSGWMDKGYLNVAKRLRSKGKIVVAALDNQWHGTTPQLLTAIFGLVGGFSLFYSHAWVAGTYQFEYARKLGFNKQNIIYDLYSADLNLFEKVYHENKKRKNANYPQRFLFVGRLELVKGVDTLLEAWRMLGDRKLNWELHLIGNGSLLSLIDVSDGVVCKNFLQSEKLPSEIANAGCFVLPSRSEPWGVVIHEFTSAGLPLIVSDKVGSSSTFLISGMNGYSFKSDDPIGLANRMEQVIRMSHEDIISMSDNSHLLSRRITPESSASNLLSLSISG